MNLRKQVEPLQKAALQASSLQRHAHHAASRLTWVKRWLKRAYHHHAQSRELKRSTDPSPRFATFARFAGDEEFPKLLTPAECDRAGAPVLRPARPARRRG